MANYWRNQLLQLVQPTGKIEYVKVQQAHTRADNGRSFVTVESSWDHSQPSKKEFVILPNGAVLNLPLTIKISDYRPFWSTDDLAKYDERHEGYFFSANNMGFASSRILSGVYNAPDGSLINLFITSERDRYNSDPKVAARRMYTVRQLRENGVFTIGAHMGYSSARSARTAAQRLINAAHFVQPALINN